MHNWDHSQNVLFTCRKESESCFVCLGCESPYYSMHGLHYHLNRTRYKKQGSVGKSPPKVVKKKSTTFSRHSLSMFGCQWFLLLELKIIFIFFKVRIRWTGKNSKQKKLQRSLCEVRETFIEKISTSEFWVERNGNSKTVVRHAGNLFMCLGPGCGYTIGYLTGMHR